MSVKSKAILFGLNYTATPDSSLTGSINDVFLLENLLRERFNADTYVYTDDTTPNDTTVSGIITRLYQFAMDTRTNQVDMAVIVYSGHGASVKDTNGDELDGMDECIIPRDYKSNGVITDDVIQLILKLFNPKTRVVCIFDCCKSGTITDLPYVWNQNGVMSRSNNKLMSSKVLTISASQDNQYAVEMKDATTGRQQGVLTSCIYKILLENQISNVNCFRLLSLL